MLFLPMVCMWCSTRSYSMPAITSSFCVSLPCLCDPDKGVLWSLSVNITGKTAETVVWHLTAYLLLIILPLSRFTCTVERDVARRRNCTSSVWWLLPCLIVFPALPLRYEGSLCTSINYCLLHHVLLQCCLFTLNSWYNKLCFEKLIY